MVSMAQGNIPFHEKNLTEVIKRNVRCGRLAYSTDVECVRAQGAGDFSSRRRATAPGRSGAADCAGGCAAQHSFDCDAGPGWRRFRSRSDIQAGGLRATIVSQPMFFTSGCAVEDFDWPDRIILGTSSNEAVLVLKQIFHSLVMRGVPVIVTNHETANWRGKPRPPSLPLKFPSSTSLRLYASGLTPTR